MYAADLAEQRQVERAMLAAAREFARRIEIGRSLKPRVSRDHTAACEALLRSLRTTAALRYAIARERETSETLA